MAGGRLAGRRAQHIRRGAHLDPLRGGMIGDLVQGGRDAPLPDASLRRRSGTLNPLEEVDQCLALHHEGLTHLVPAGGGKHPDGLAAADGEELSRSAGRSRNGGAAGLRNCCSIVGTRKIPAGQLGHCPRSSLTQLHREEARMCRTSFLEGL